MERGFIMTIFFLCKNELVFLTNFDKCLVCFEKETCLNYNYEVDFQKRKEQESKQ